MKWRGGYGDDARTWELLLPPYSKKTEEKKDAGDGYDCTLLRGRAEEKERWEVVGEPAPGGGTWKRA